MGDTYVVDLRRAHCSVRICLVGFRACRSMFGLWHIFYCNTHLSLYALRVVLECQQVALIQSELLGLWMRFGLQTHCVGWQHVCSKVDVNLCILALLGIDQIQRMGGKVAR